MPKKKDTTGNLISGYDDWSVTKLIDEAKNVARWNPWLAHQWMKEAANRINSIEQYRLIDKHDDAVDQINAYWRMISKMRFYDAKTFWSDERGLAVPPKMLAKIISDDNIHVLENSTC